ncbi:ribosomal protein S18 acetylase RimI-like enzyme [Rhizobium leguminosarum]|uniref:Ribosomal protein S18 acetylase RimI-like enzyme n=1 Tax=Rhizobium leguminosarum TaxID=384 RepID=A0A7Z0DVA6_RHILE|nr:GNAT family N-acetyltransferase [Rhizobium leguminosarum]NYJ09993.1 ribosomal protein S18 acetylase RimI-like enzyme [Rhizobium leguminosarum]
MDSNCFIRPAIEADIDALFDICLKTANGGEDASALYSDPHLPGYIWSVPYLKFARDFAFVLVQGNRPVGYVVGTRDTVGFDQDLKADWWPFVRQQVAGLTPSRPRDADVLERIQNPRSGTTWLQDDYPAHLHINILPGLQAGGWGRRMISTELEALRNHGVGAVHLGVDPNNARARGFYRHLGFSELERDDSVAFAMRIDKGSD